jgi:hypothetical protein
MMRLAVVSVALAAMTVAVVVTPSLAGETSGAWFDPDKCQMCAPIKAEPGLFEHVHWTDLPIATGMITVTKVDPGYEAAYQRAGAKQMDVVQRRSKGESMYLCGHCTSLSGLLKSGAKYDPLQVSDRYLAAVTATDPALIQKIRAHAERTDAEMKKMMTAKN